MENDDSLFVDYSEPLPRDLDEHSRTLLNLAKVYTTAKRVHAPSKEAVNKRAKEKGIEFGRARQELVNERKPLLQKLVNEALKDMSPDLSEEERRRLGIKGRGRPKGAKNKNTKLSKMQLYGTLELLIKSMNQAGEELSQEEAAKLLRLGGARQLRRLFRDYEDGRRWKDIVNDLLVK